MSAKKKIVAIASSTGGPKALAQIWQQLPPNLDAPICIVQHMPEGFTKILASRVREQGGLVCEEATEGVVLQKGHIYVAKAGSHMGVTYYRGEHRITTIDAPPREGVKPCANYLFESLADGSWDEILCVVLTGMGADGTVGLKALKKQARHVTVFAQDKASCTVYGMPKCAMEAGVVDEVIPITEMAAAIIKKMGVKEDGY